MAICISMQFMRKHPPDNYAKSRGFLLESTNGIYQRYGCLSFQIQLWDWPARWWFQTYFVFTSIWGRFPFWLIFFRWVETTNQPGVAPPKLCFGLFHCCLKRYVARRQLVSAEYVPRRKKIVEQWSGGCTGSIEKAVIPHRFPKVFVETTCRVQFNEELVVWMSTTAKTLIGFANVWTFKCWSGKTWEWLAGAPCFLEQSHKG